MHYYRTVVFGCACALSILFLPNNLAARAPVLGERVDIETFPGTIAGFSLPVENAETVRAARILIKTARLDPGADPACRKSPVFKSVVASPGASTLTLSIEAREDQCPGTYRGILRLQSDWTRPVSPSAPRSAGGIIPRPPYFPVTISVVTPSNDPEVIPPDPAVPVESRIVETDTGGEVVKDELLVLLRLATPDPDQVIREIATATNGTIIGSTPANTYQVQYTVADLAELGQIQEQILRDYFQVAAVVPNVVYRNPLAAPPNDPGTNLGSWPDVIRLPEAWDIVAGIAGETSCANAVAPKTQVAIIDRSFDIEPVATGSPTDGHEDLVGNVRRINARNLTTTDHGTQVAGIVGAVTDNGIGVAGVACNQADLNLIDYSTITPGTQLEAIRYQNAIANAIIQAPSAAPSIINMSLQAHRALRAGGVNPGTATVTSSIQCTDGSDGCTYVEVCNTVIGQAMSMGDAMGKDLLYVVAAGNLGNATNDPLSDAALECPASLVTVPEHADKVIVVAATNAAATSLRNDSNRGPAVTIAAPGTNIRTTRRDNTYADFSGTSVATPVVAGVAALKLARDALENGGAVTKTATDVKECIVSNAQPFGASIDFDLLDAERAVDCVLPLPERLDLVFSVDTSGSMNAETQRVKDEIAAIVAAVEEEITDVRFGVVSYEDYAGTFDSSSCGSTYASTFGSAVNGDQPFRINQPLTADVAGEFLPAVAGLVNRNGGDLAQSYGRVYWEVARAARNAPGSQPLNFRDDSCKVIVDFGDDVPHDTNLNEGITAAPIGEESGFDRGRDPGRDNTTCTADDIDFQDDALAEMEDAKVALIHFTSSDDPFYEIYWRNWTERTGGNVLRLNTDGSSPSGQSLSAFILGELRLIAARVCAD